MKMPSMQFYPADWRKDLAVQSLGFYDRGVWFEMLCLMHESSERGILVLNGMPMLDSMVANLLGLDNQIFNQTLSTLLTYGVAKRRESDNAIYCKRMVDDEKLCKIRREAGKKGGNPALLNQNKTTTDNQNPTPSSSTSSSSSPSGKLKPSAKNRDDVYSSEFETAWDLYPDRPGSSKRESFKAWSARLKAGVDSSTILAGVGRYAAFVEVMRTEPRFIKQPATFFGPDEHYRSDWTPQQLRAGPPQAYQTPNEKAKEFADKLTGNKKNEYSNIIDITPTIAGSLD